MHINHLRKEKTMKTQSKFVDKQQTGVFFSCFENFAVSSFADFRENFIDFNSSFAPLTLKIIFTMLKNTFLTKKKKNKKMKSFCLLLFFTWVFVWVCQEMLDLMEKENSIYNQAASATNESNAFDQSMEDLHSNDELR